MYALASALVVADQRPVLEKLSSALTKRNGNDVARFLLAFRRARSAPGGSVDLVTIRRSLTRSSEASPRAKGSIEDVRNERAEARG